MQLISLLPDALQLQCQRRIGLSLRHISKNRQDFPAFQDDDRRFAEKFALTLRNFLDLVGGGVGVAFAAKKDE